MKRFSSILIALAIIASAVPALAGSFTPPDETVWEQVWGEVAQACLDRHYIGPPEGSICSVVNKKSGQLTMWCPRGLDPHFQLREACNTEANDVVRFWKQHLR